MAQASAPDADLPRKVSENARGSRWNTAAFDDRARPRSRAPDLRGRPRPAKPPGDGEFGEMAGWLTAGEDGSSSRSIAGPSHRTRTVEGASTVATDATPAPPGVRRSCPGCERAYSRNKGTRPAVAPFQVSRARKSACLVPGSAPDRAAGPMFPLLGTERRSACSVHGLLARSVERPSRQCRTRQFKTRIPDRIGGHRRPLPQIVG